MTGRPPPSPKMAVGSVPHHHLTPRFGFPSPASVFFGQFPQVPMSVRLPGHQPHEVLRNGGLGILNNLERFLKHTTPVLSFVGEVVIIEESDDGMLAAHSPLIGMGTTPPQPSISGEHEVPRAGLPFPAIPRSGLPPPMSLSMSPSRPSALGIPPMGVTGAPDPHMAGSLSVSPVVTLPVAMPFLHGQMPSPTLPRRLIASVITPKPFFLLQDLWRWYDQPYGVEIPVLAEGVEVVLFFVPYLSALQLYPVPSTTTDQLRRAPFFSYVEEAPPASRIPLWEKMNELAQKSPNVMNSRSIDLGPESWYAVSWYPIAINMHTKSIARGCFVTYHRFAPDPRTAQPLAVLPVAPSATSFLAPVMQAPLLLCGLIPYKVRSDIWYTLESIDSSGVKLYIAPIFLFAAVPRLLALGPVVHNDYLHCAAHMRGHLEALAWSGVGLPQHRRRPSAPNISLSGVPLSQPSSVPSSTQSSPRPSVSGDMHTGLELSELEEMTRDMQL